MTYPLVITFCTPSYYDLMKTLAASVAVHGLRHYTEVVDSRGSWEENCAYKPTFILNAMEKFNEPLLWIDADAELKQEPKLFALPTDFDFAIYQDTSRMNSKVTRFGSGTLFFAPQAMPLLKEWEHRQLRNRKMWDQQVLLEAYESMNNKPITLFLPRAYRAKFDDKDADKAVILHYQASRTRK